MLAKECIKGVCARRKRTCEEMEEWFRKVLPDSFWEHARASRQEAKLARKAFRRAIKGQFGRTSPKTSVTSQPIDIT